MPPENNARKNRTLIIIIIVTAMLIALATLTAILLIHHHNAKHQESEISQNEPYRHTTDCGDTRPCTVSFQECSQDKNCIATININSKEMALEYLKTNNNTAALYLRDKQGKDVLLTTLKGGSNSPAPYLSKIFLYDDIIVYSTHGDGIYNDILTVNNYDGTTIKQISAATDTLDPNHSHLRLSDFRAETHSIVLIGSALGPSNSFLWEDTELFICENPYTTYGLTGDELFSANYAMTYLGSNQLGPIEIIQDTTKTLKQALDSGFCE